MIRPSPFYQVHVEGDARFTKPEPVPPRKRRVLANLFHFLLWAEIIGGIAGVGYRWRTVCTRIMAGGARG